LKYVTAAKHVAEIYSVQNKIAKHQIFVLSGIQLHT